MPHYSRAATVGLPQLVIAIHSPTGLGVKASPLISPTGVQVF